MIHLRLRIAFFSLAVALAVGCIQQLHASPADPTPALREVVEEYWPDGQLRLRKEVLRRSDGTLVDDGKFQRWHANGLREYEALFSLGEKEGTTLRYHRNGRPAARQEYRDGERHGTSASWDDSGVKVKEESWADGLPHGTWTVWKNGRVEWMQTYATGVPTIAAPAAADKQAPTVEKSGHVETPRDPYLPTPPQTEPARRTVVRSQDDFVSVQVNTDQFGNNIVGDAANEPSIAVDPTDPTKIAIGWRQFDNIASNFRQAGWGFTTDAGNSWTFPGVIEPGVFRSDPVLNSDADGNFFYNSLTADDGTNFRCHVFKSIDGGATWDSGVYAFGGDKQWQIIDQTDGIGRGNVYVAWNSFFSSCSGGFTRSYDAGQTFEPCTTVAGDPQWGTLAVGTDGELYVSGTGMSVAKSTTMQDSGQAAAWDFNLTVDLDGSLQFSAGPNPAGLLGQNWIDIDRSSGPNRGNVYMLASVDRNSNADPLDVMFSRSTDGGQTWSPPVRVNDDPGTTAWQWLGTMSVAPNGRIDAVWLDTRNDTGGGYLSELYYSYSTDTGLTWSPNVALTPAFDPHVGWPQQNKMGDYFHMISDDLGANLAYAATFNGEQDVYFARIGDPACPDAGRVTLDRPKYACDGLVDVRVLDCGLNTDDGLAESLVVAIDSDTETGFETVTLNETSTASPLFEGSIPLGETDAGGLLHVTEGDTITVTYVDADDGAGGTNVDVTAQAPVECTPPIISNVQTIDIEAIRATVTFDSDEPTRGTVHYGLGCGAFSGTTVGNGFATSPEVGLTGLSKATTYYFVVEAEDEAGNAAADDNGGLCHTFVTPDVPNYFTEQFTSGVDLDGLKLTFTPSGSIDYYAGCAESITALPTDPAGGLPLVLGDDSEAQAVLAEGKTVLLYGVASPSFWVTANGYVTLVGGETSYTETYAQHFSVARVAALFDDLNPATGGAVSWKQLGDRAVATWEGVPEVGGVGANTFQIELFFDGTITISYLGITCADAIVGLSDGGGLSPVFYPTDLSAVGSCGPRPPLALSTEVNTETGTPVAIPLQASDDGLPAIPGALTYVIVGLPSGGYLEDLGAGSIVGVPYTLAGNGSDLLYVPAPGNLGPDSFQFVANDGGIPPDGGESNIATVTVTQGGPVLLHEVTLDTDPGWTTEGQWAFGQPTGGGTPNGDPTTGFTGTNVYGYNLNGDYPSNMGVESLTSPSFDLTGASDTRIEFQRWLGVESSTYDHASLLVSANGVDWTLVWDHSGGTINDNSWSLMSYDIAPVADDQSTVSFRWIMGSTDGSVTYPGWNIDDIAVWGDVPSVGCDAAPDEPLSFVVWPDKQTLDWMPPADFGGTEAPVYDLLRSTSADDFTTSPICIESNDGTNSYAVDPADPPPGVVFHYLVRAENGCGGGSWGRGSDDLERNAIDCSGG